MTIDRMKLLWLLALLLLVSVCGFSQTHSYCPTDGVCAWSGAQTYADTNGTKHVTSNATDLGTQVNALISALGVQGGVIHIAKNTGGYTIAGGNEINADNSVNLTIVCDGGVTAGAQAAVKITTTGTATPVSARSTTGFRLLGCQFVATNAGMTGDFVDLGHAGANGDSALFEIAYDSFFGSGVNVPIQISTDKANSGKIHDNSFGGYVVAIQGMATNVSYSNQVAVRNNHFSSSTGSATGSHIRNPGGAWDISDNTFEQGHAAGIPNVLDCTVTSTAFDTIFTGNTIQDDNETVNAHTWITGCAFAGSLIAGNTFAGNTTRSKAIDLPASSFATLQGNLFQNLLAAMNLSGTTVRLDSGVNQFNTVGTVRSGNLPLVGKVFDASDVMNWYGSNVFRNNSVTLANQLDAEQDLIIAPGLSADQAGCLMFKDFTFGAVKGKFCKASDNKLQVTDIDGDVRLQFANLATNDSTFLDSKGTGVVFINGSATSGNTLKVCAAGANCNSVITNTNVSSPTYSTTTNCASTGGTCVAAPAGRVTIAAAAATVVVATTAVTANSEIKVTRDNSLGTALSVTCNTQSSLVLGTPYVSARSAGTSFTVTIDVAPTTNPLCMSYEIVN